jgi:hypothetical protein
MPGEGGQAVNAAGMVRAAGMAGDSGLSSKMGENGPVGKMGENGPGGKMGENGPVGKVGENDLVGKMSGNEAGSMTDDNGALSRTAGNGTEEMAPFRWFAGIMALAALVYGGVLYYALKGSGRIFSSVWMVIGLVVVLAGVTLFLLYPALVRLSKRNYLLLIAVVGGGLRLGWVLWMDTPPVSDFQFMHSAASSAAQGDFSFALSEYFVRWNYQLGFTLYQALVIKLLGNSLLILELLNGLFTLATAYTVYGIGRQLFGENAGRMAGLLYALYLPSIIMGSVLTNQHLSTFLLTLGVYCAVSPERRRYNGLAVGLWLGLGHLIRPLGSFYLVCYLLYVGVSLFFPANKSKRKSLLAHVASAAVVFVLVQQLFSYALVFSGVVPKPLGGWEPYWKVMVGLNPATIGGWSLEDDQYAHSFPLGEERNKAEQAVIKERLADKWQVANLFVLKFEKLWGSTDAAVYWSFMGTDKVAEQQPLIKAERLMYVLMTGLCCVAFVALTLRRSASNPAVLLVLLILGGYAALHLVIEVQARYRMDVLPLYMVASGYGVVWLRQIGQRKPRSKSSRKVKARASAKAGAGAGTGTGAGAGAGT